MAPGRPTAGGRRGAAWAARLPQPHVVGPVDLMPSCAHEGNENASDIARIAPTRTLILVPQILETILEGRCGETATRNSEDP